MIINILIAIVYGTVEGICEWLPISSTGHLILLEEILPIELGEKYGENFSEVFRATFDVVVQLAAVAAIPIIYRKDLFSLSNDAHKLRAKILVATLPAAIIGLLADALCEKIFGDRFSAVRGARQGVPLKPDPCALFEICDLLGVDSKEVAYFGDTCTDMETGRRFGAALNVGVLWGFRGEDELRASGADRIISDPSEIAELVLSV